MKSLVLVSLIMFNLTAQEFSPSQYRESLREQRTALDPAARQLIAEQINELALLETQLADTEVDISWARINGTLATTLATATFIYLIETNNISSRQASLSRVNAQIQRLAEISRQLQMNEEPPIQLEIEQGQYRRGIQTARTRRAQSLLLIPMGLAMSIMSYRHDVNLTRVERQELLDQITPLRERLDNRLRD